jgi:hypothetical protein
MANDDRKRDEAPEETHPIDPPVGGDERYRLESPDDAGAPTDVGKTSGGGSLGHVQPDKVEREAPLRNNAERRESDEPTLPKESTLKTKI